MFKILLFFCLYFITGAIAYEHPGGMHPKKQIDFVKEKIKQKEHPYYEAYQVLIAEADSALRENAQAGMAENIRLIKSNLFHKIAPDGLLPEEVKRQDNRSCYTCFSLAPIPAASWVTLQTEGSNLFTCQEDGRSLKTPLDYMLCHSQHPDQWKWFQNLRPGSPTYWPVNLSEAMHGIYQDEAHSSYVKDARPYDYPKQHFAWTFSTLTHPFLAYA